MFSGSYIDSLITGTMTPGGGRGIVASAAALISANNIRDSGSLFRGFSTRNSSERYYDTILPDTVGYLRLTNRVDSIVARDSGKNIVTLDPPRYFMESGTYRMPFPFNNELMRSDASDENVLLTTDVGAGSFISGSILRRALYKVADRRIRLDDNRIDNPHADKGAMAFRYGLYNIYPINTRAVYRYNKYGQFRDMLEQRHDSKFQITGIPELGTVNGTLQSPVFIRFSGPPASTNSSNLSIEATSSLPYFDGSVRNREDPLNASILGTTVVEIM